jgi:hypothetical protein
MTDFDVGLSSAAMENIIMDETAEKFDFLVIGILPSSMIR